MQLMPAQFPSPTRRPLGFYDMLVMHAAIVAESASGAAQNITGPRRYPAPPRDNKLPDFRPSSGIFGPQPGKPVDSPVQTARTGAAVTLGNNGARAGKIRAFIASALEMLADASEHMLICDRPAFSYGSGLDEKRRLELQ